MGEDKLLYLAMGELGVAETGYPLISVYEDFTPDKSLKRYGSSIDWSFGALGIPTFSTELWDVFTAAGIERDDFYPLRNFPEDDQLKLLHWQDEALGGEGFMPWTPFEHPQLGPVEIGGWKRMFTFRNPPPAQYLEEMARANCRFTLRHAASAPQSACATSRPHRWATTCGRSAPSSTIPASCPRISARRLWPCTRPNQSSPNCLARRR